MGEPLVGVRLTGPVSAALRQAALHRPDTGILGTQGVLVALESADSMGDWSRLLIDDRPCHDPPQESDGADTWGGVPLSASCAVALARARDIAEQYDLSPIPPGVLALALVWDPSSAAARSCLGVEHGELLELIQEDILGSMLVDVERFLEPGSRVTAEADPDEEQEPDLSDSEIASSLRHVVTFVPRWALMMLTAVAVVGVVLGITTSQAWRYAVDDDLAPPLVEPAIGGAIPPDEAISTIVGREVVRVQDGRPRTRVFDSSIPMAYDFRTQAIDGAWAAHWDSVEGSIEIEVEIVSQTYDVLTATFTNYCSPAEPEAVVPPFIEAGYMTKSDTGAAYCSFAFYRRTQIFFEVASLAPGASTEIPAQVASIQSSIQAVVPEPTSPPLTTIPTPYTTAQLDRGLLLVIVAVPLLWLLPTLLFDRATWQRLWWTLSLRRFRSLPLPGLDIDPEVRARLWASLAQACVQVCVATWVLRLTLSTTWGPIWTAIAVVAAVLAVSAIPRWVYLRRVGRTQTFAGKRRVIWLLGLVGVAVGVAVAAFTYYVANTMASLPAGINSPDYAQQRVSIMLRLLALPVALLALIPMTMMRRLAMRAMRTERSTDLRPPILLLRSFADDGRRLRGRSSHRRALPERLSLRRWERFEEVVAASLAAHGPVLAVGQVGERLPPPLGAVRRQFTNEEWQEAVYDLMTKSSLICVTLGRSANLRWEIGRIANSGFLHKTIFVLPPTSRREHLKRLTVLASALDIDWADLNVDISGSWCLAVRVPAVGAQPQLVRARAQEDVGYDIALEIARLAVAGLEIHNPSLSGELDLVRPAPEVFDPGKTPAFKPLIRRKTTWLLLPLFSSSITALTMLLLFGEEPGDFTAIRLAGGNKAWAVAVDPESNVVYNVTNGTLLGSLDFDARTGDPIAKIEPAEGLVASDGWVFASSPTYGTLQAVDVSTKAVAWSLEGLEGVRGVSVSDEALYFVLPARREVRAVDRRTGQAFASMTMDGTPWATATGADTVDVSLIDTSEVLQLDPDSLSVESRIDVPGGPSQLALVAGSLWVYSVSEHSLTAVDGAAKGHVVWTRSESPSLSTNGQLLAIEGVEQVTTISPDGTVMRGRLTTRHASDLAVLDNGDVVAMTDDQILLIHPEE